LRAFHIAKHGDDDEVGVEIAGLPAGKGLFYVALIIGAVYRAVVGLATNTFSSGVESSYGKLWLIAAIVLAVMTFFNYKSFQAKTGAISYRS